mmetsp:Transcript_19549/g.17313  ORF Transcript_19549/g.17313 Transcript_19549/m.17313 type:complete len:208 (+) Transcript_19549:155-778(+)|eukprot:CAMPEP_0201580850 /NCGR_PEP_ID=MMETSP0190_2-20130828/57290_1 /ASSEMBLY_ACC=CAM_ASM_000263 /TAXON_ID=37353 /ORGANISM="Rosalina sp." /LENGTH=207 /DNA_ID=CAMNT_0048017709 /DNA_START=146 /DNA_END=769 /DNA_ORIENTATION=+
MNMEHVMRDIVSNGDTFQFAKMVKEEEYDIKTKDSVYTTLLHTAVEYDQIEMFRMLIDYGMDINSKSSELTLANTCLHEAVNKNNLNMVDTILELKGDVNICNNLGLTPLALATLKGHSKIALYLLSKEADPTIEDKEGKTAYIHAKENGNYELLQHLPEKQWSLEDDPKWKALIEAKIKAIANGEGGSKKGNKKGKKGKKKGKKKK